MVTLVGAVVRPSGAFVGLRLFGCKRMMMICVDVVCVEKPQE